jgi:hypothetical protein
MNYVEKFFFSLCLMFAALFLITCADDSKPPPPTSIELVDMETDKDVEGDLIEDVNQPTEGSPCRRNSDCPRGTTCHVDTCIGARGCVFLAFPGVGCFFDHGMDFDEGLFSTAECQEDSDCANPDEPNCIARICSRLTPCTEDDQCAENQTCRHAFYCK